MAPAAAIPDPSPGRVYILDAHGMVFQMFHGIPAMNAADGRPTNAVFGVTRGLMDLYDRGADYLIAVFDHKDPTFRSAIAEDYKAHRPPPPDELLQQEPLIDQVLQAMRIPRLCLPGYEADDLMATLAVNAAERGHEVFLCTADKDCRQCLTDRIKILNLRKGEQYDADSLLKDWGVRPDQVIDYQAMVGDSADNVKGVPGVGPKTASKWLQQYGTLDGIAANADALTGPKVKAAFKQAYADGTLARSKSLVKLMTDVPMAFDWPAWRRRDWDGPALLALFEEFGFRGFAQKVRGTLTKSGAKKNFDLLAAIGEAPARPADNGLFSDIPADDAPAAEAEAAPVSDWPYENYKLVNTPELFDAFFADLSKQPAFVFDLETTSLDPLTAEIVGYAFSWAEADAYYLPVRGPAGEPLLDPDATLAALKPLFENPTVEKRNQNIKYDLLVLRSNGVTLAGVAGDPMLAHYLLDAAARGHGLDELALQVLRHENISIKSLIGVGKKQIGMADVPTAKVKDYAAEDADVAFRLATTFEADLAKDAKLLDLYRTVELPLIDVLAEMEFNGCLLDMPYLANLSTEMAGQLTEIEADIHRIAGKPFNIASPGQLRTILFDELNLPVQKRTDKTGEPSTDQESLEKLAALHELPRRIIDQRQVAKLKSTYVDALPALVNAKTGRVHTSFNQTVAATGRLSSSDPNLQNIPTRTEQGQQIRAAFIAPPGWQILTADYSQVELRLLAHFCGDERLIDAFAADKDVHAAVAAEIFKVPEAAVTSAQRRVAKTVNFGVVYGISAFGLAARLGVPRGEAEAFINGYFDRYPKVLQYQQDVLTGARKHGFVPTILGRRRPFDPSAIRPKSTYQQRTQAEREAINMEIQGSAADLMKLAMLAVHRRLKAEKSPAKLLLTVHDELVLEVPVAGVAAAARVCREEMAGAMALRVPLKVDVAAGANWLAGADVA